jgi:hypothetical protein
MRAARARRFDQRRDVRLYCARGADMPQAKLTDASAAAILARYRPYSRTDGAAALAREHGVHVNTVLKLTSRESWAHLTHGHIQDLFGDLPARAYRKRDNE